MVPVYLENFTAVSSISRIELLIEQIGVCVLQLFSWTDFGTSVFSQGSVGVSSRNCFDFMVFLTRVYACMSVAVLRWQPGLLQLLGLPWLSTRPAVHAVHGSRLRRTVSWLRVCVFAY